MTRITKRSLQPRRRTTFARTSAIGLLVAVSLMVYGGVRSADAQVPLEITASALSVVANEALCLDVSGGGTDPGTNVQLFPCNSTASQNWSLTFAGEIQSHVAPNRCLDVSGGSSEPGTNVQLFPCNGTDSQLWTQTAAGEFRSNLGSDLCLDISGGNTEPGTNVQLFSCNGTDSQQWNVVILR